MSFAAYLVGVLSKSLNPPLVRLGTFNAYIPKLIKVGFSRAFGRTREAFYLTHAEIRPTDFWRRLFYTTSSSMTAEEKEQVELEFFEKDNIVTGRLSRIGVFSLDDLSRRAADEGEINKDAASKYYTYLLRVVPQLGNALVGKETGLYSVYDRLISEYEFRIGISAPLIALIVTLADRWSLLWLLALLPVLVLLATGSQQRMAAGDLLADAVRLKRIDIALPRELAPTAVHPSVDQYDHTNHSDQGSSMASSDPRPATT